MAGMKYATELVTREVVRAPRLMEEALTEADQIGFEQPGNEGNRDDVDIPVPSETVDNGVPTIVDNFLSDDEMGPQDIPSARDEHGHVAEIEPSTSQVPNLKKQSGHLFYSSGNAYIPIFCFLILYFVQVLIQIQTLNL